MNPLALACLVMAGFASVCSLGEDGFFGRVRRSIKPGNWDKEMAQEWDAARNMRPCIGTKDPSCAFHDADQVKP